MEKGEGKDIHSSPPALEFFAESQQLKAEAILRTCPKGTDS